MCSFWLSTLYINPLATTKNINPKPSRPVSVQSLIKSELPSFTLNSKSYGNKVFVKVNFLNAVSWDPSPVPKIGFLFKLSFAICKLLNRTKLELLVLDIP